MKKRELEGLVGRIRQARRATAAEGEVAAGTGSAVTGGAAGSGSTDVDRIAGLEQRVAHLERLLEGFQDSVYRESERHAKMITDLQLQVEPGAMSASLAEDARNRGL
jgi:uncharacterized coiled-coil protein SlyX